MVNTYEVGWFKTYHVTGTVEIKANSLEEAEHIANDQLGDYEGSMDYDDGGITDSRRIETRPHASAVSSQ
jgi:hypothetical protein